MRRNDKFRKVDRAFQQRGLIGLRELLHMIERERLKGNHLQQIGSSSIIDPRAHIARLKKAMGMRYSTMDGIWAGFDNDASLYVGFFPGKLPRIIDPLDWLNLLADALPRVHEETREFLDSLFAELVDIHSQVYERILWSGSSKAA